MDCSTRRVLACIACASDRWNAIDTLCRNHVHNKLMEGLDRAHSLDANVVHSTKIRSDLSDNATFISKANFGAQISSQHSKSQYLHALHVSLEPIKVGSQCAPDARAGATHE